jgi:DDE superfamily endonuclease
MEDVLAVYTRPHNPDYPLVCLDETSKQLVAETRTPIPMKRGRTARIDYEYERNGTANLFMLFAPLEGWRHVEVTDRHTAVDYAHVLKDLADRRFPHAKTIVLVQDNLNIHSKASNGNRTEAQHLPSSGGSALVSQSPTPKAAADDP